MSDRKVLHATLIAVASVVFPSLAMAGAVNVPSVAEPDRVRDRLQVIERPTVSGEPLITLSDEGGKPLKSNVSFTLKKVSIEGLTAVSEDKLAKVYADYIGEKVTLGTLQDITRRMTATLRNEGFVLSRAILPPQRINKSGAL